MRFAFVARRAVASSQDVQLIEPRAGVAYVATNGGIGPPHFVGVKTQVQVHQLDHNRDVIVGVLQCRHPIARHATTHHIMVMERDTLALLDRTGLGLSNVVEQRGQPNDAKIKRHMHHGPHVAPPAWREARA
jgi:hypothetical protein